MVLTHGSEHSAEELGVLCYEPETVFFRTSQTQAPELDPARELKPHLSQRSKFL